MTYDEVANVFKFYELKVGERFWTQLRGLGLNNKLFLVAYTENLLEDFFQNITSNYKHKFLTKITKVSSYIDTCT